MKLPTFKDPISKNSYDSIFVIIDRLINYGIFLFYRKNSNTEQLAYTFLREIIANHGLPEEIISDRNKLIISKFWTSLIA